MEKMENSEKKCSKCDESRKKIKPYIIASIFFLGLVIYAVVDIVKNIIELFSH